jgi:proline-rich protein PRCC
VQLFSKLPAASKRKVLLRPQIDLQLLAQQSDSDDDEPVAKKIKAAAPAAGKSSVLSFLPAPKHAAAGKRMDAGAGTKSSAFAEAQQHKQQQQEQEQQRAAQAAAVGPQATASNELYRMRPAAAAPPAVNAYHQQYCGQYEQQSEQQCVQEEYAAAGAYGAYDASVQQQPQRHQQQQYQQLAPEEVFLQEALQAEASKAARRAAGVGSSQLVMPDIQFKEIKADEVKYVDPAQKEAAQGMRSALGTDYAQQLRSQAAPHMGSKLARCKHQIGTLFANAKLRELEVMENRASGMKTKAETAGKYGW